MKGSPWSFDDAIVLLEDPKGRCSVESIDFKYVDFWVHFHKLPSCVFCRKYATTLGNSIGKFEATNKNGKMKGETLKMKVKLDVNQLIKRGTNVKVGSMADKTWIKVTYEKLPDFCYYCGKLGHVVHDCEEE